ncbi:MAG: isoprenylcysteine carboxylmethyltransferase family protein [Kiritimatiellae bacterium]|nr:isoprenylcysteine carboxylmethyltransferase family protein [Kiritimatiellia bacterium]MDD5523233.1 isoprenylcysteine carboxylmethyltransferase family protein [Kiritimatiellia bacterium]
MSSDLTAVGCKPWWKGARGEWFVVVQIVFMGLVFLGPRTVAGQPAWRFPFPQVCMLVGGALMVMGGVLFVAGLVRIGRRLTPLPYPKDKTELIQTGAFALVRHPMYGGGLIFCLGWALYIHGWLTLGYVVGLFVSLDMKARREEKWLTEKFPEYVAYRQRVRKFIPFVY